MLLPAEGLGSLTLLWNWEVLGSTCSLQSYCVSSSLLVQSAQKFPGIETKCQNFLSWRMHHQAANLSLLEFSEPPWISHSFLPSPVLTWALAVSLEIWEVDVNPHRLRKTDSKDLGFFGHPLCKYNFVKSRQIITAIPLHLPKKFIKEPWKIFQEACNCCLPACLEDNFLSRLWRQLCQRSP